MAGTCTISTSRSAVTCGECCHAFTFLLAVLVRTDEAGCPQRVGRKLFGLGASELANIAALDCCSLSLVHILLACSVLSVFCCVMMALPFSNIILITV